MILISSQPVFALSAECFMLSREATNTNSIVFGLSRPEIKQRSTALEASMLTIAPPMQFHALEQVVSLYNLK
jgi:hypothetical protein